MSPTPTRSRGIYRKGASIYDVRTLGSRGARVKAQGSCVNSIVNLSSECGQGEGLEKNWRCHVWNLPKKEVVAVLGRLQIPSAKTAIRKNVASSFCV